MQHSVRLTTDKVEIEAVLRRDWVYAAYALGDLEPEQSEYCTWYLAEAAQQVSALALVYRRLEPPVLLTMGDPAGVAAIFEAVALPARIYMASQLATLPVFQAHYDFGDDRVRPMVRMAVSGGTFQPAGRQADGHLLRRLGVSDVPAIEALVAHGGPFAPDAFSPAQVAEGLFYGVEAGTAARSDPGELLAVAGTHLVAHTTKIAAVGNIYTHPGYRGQGCGQLVTTAVTADLLDQGLHVVLNVDSGNATAIHMYEKLGYRTHCPFVEGVGRRSTIKPVHPNRQI